MSVSEQLVKLVHVYIAILLLVLVTADLRSSCSGRGIAIIVLVSCVIFAFLAFLIGHNLEIKLGCWGYNCRSDWNIFFD